MNRRPEGMVTLDYTAVVRHSEATDFHIYAGSKDTWFNASRRPFELWLHFPDGEVKTYGTHQEV